MPPTWLPPSTIRFAGGKAFFAKAQTFEQQGPDTPGLTRLEHWLTRHWACTLWTGGVGCPCLRRWQLLSTRWGKLFVHHFLADDWSLDLHDHSGRMVSVGLKGSYEEQTPAGSRVWRAPWVRAFPATHTHRLRLLTPTVWTLVWVRGKVRRSGFWVAGRWLSQDAYLAKHAQHRKSC